MSSFDNIRDKVHCCACGKPAPIGRINLVSLPRRATWKYPIASNVLTGYGPQAVAICCDACVEADPPRRPVEAVELIEGECPIILYHPVDSLAKLGLEPTHLLMKNGLAIQCLVCGSISSSKSDVEHRFCSNCGKFHPIRADENAVHREG